MYTVPLRRVDTCTIMVIIVAVWLLVCVRQNSSMDVIQKNWFGVSSRKSSTAAEVQSYLSAFEHIHLPLLFAVVNMADADVRIRRRARCALFLLSVA